MYRRRRRDNDNSGLSHRSQYRLHVLLLMKEKDRDEHGEHKDETGGVGAHLGAPLNAGINHTLSVDASHFYWYEKSRCQNL